MVDYPNHMARMHILADGGHSPWLRQYYEIHWGILPNLSMDLVVPPLTRFMSLETAGKVFIGLTFALLAGGVMALHAALHRRWSPWPLLAFFFLYNSVFLWGFLNYLFGLGLALLTCGLWIVLRDRSATLIVPLFSLLAVVLFFAHLFAFGVFAMIVLAYEFAQWWTYRRAPVRTQDFLSGKHFRPSCCRSSCCSCPRRFEPLLTTTRPGSEDRRLSRLSPLFLSTQDSKP